MEELGQIRHWTSGELVQPNPVEVGFVPPTMGVFGTVEQDQHNLDIDRPADEVRLRCNPPGLLCALKKLW
jgi:hypothetical protein